MSNGVMCMPDLKEIWKWARMKRDKVNEFLCQTKVVISEL